MKICMVGLGSIGKRHLQNLSEVLDSRKIAYQIDALRSTERKLGDLEKLMDTTYTDVNELPDNYDIIFITNPTNKHYEYVAALAAKTKHMFIEKPIFDRTDYLLENIPRKNHGVYYIACPLRHTGIIAYAKEMVSSQKVISVRAICSSYLPDWRKGVDYRQVYSSQKAMGGGVTLDLIHEWDYIFYLFGMPKRVVRIGGHYSDLEGDAEDLAVYIGQYKDKLVEVHLDYFGRENKRVLELYTNHAKYVLDFRKNRIEIYDGDGCNEIYLEETDFYKTEMNYFLDCIQGKQSNFNTMEEAYQLLKMVCETDGGNYENFIYHMCPGRVQGIEE